MSILLKKITMLIISSMVASITFAQNTTTVTGFVIDDNGNVLPGVTVTPKGKGPGVITNNEGKFVITIPNNTKLQFTYIGFDSKEVLPNGKVMNVQLRPSSVSLQETVVVGYGSQSRKTLTTSISKLNGDKVEGLPISTLGEGLKGKLSGTRFYSTNNSPGQDVTIRIRGGSSINKSNDPLILVDGIERPMSGISSNDIKSIEVLKDAASTAIYGSRASNGVVLITTKNGLANQAPIITFEATLATQSAETKYDFMNARDYINIVRPAVAKGPNKHFNDKDGYSASSGNSESSIYSTRYLGIGESIPNGYESMPDPLDPTKTLIFQNNDWQSEIYKTTLWQNYYVGINGGGNTIKYNASLGYVDDKGIALATGYNRFNMRTNLDIAASQKLHLNIGLDYSKTRSQDFPNQMNIISRGLATPPTQKKYNSDGTPTKGYNATSPTPLFYEYNNSNKRTYKRFTGFGKATYYILPEWKIEAQVSIFNQATRYSSFQKANVFNGLRPTSEEYGEIENNKFEFYSTYKQTFDKHTISALGGYSYQRLKGNSFDASVSGASTDKVPTLSAGPNKENAIGLYDALGRYSTDARYGGHAGIVPSVMPNRLLTWETTTQLDLGLDLNIFNRVSLTFDYFDKRTKNLLFNKELPNTSGFKSVNTNIGKVKFYGFDFEISTINVRNKEWEWTSKLTWSFVKNKVLKLPDNGRDKNRIGGITLADGTAFGGLAEGEPMYRYYGFIVDHILQNQQEADNALYDSRAKGYRNSDGKRIAGRKEIGDYEWKNRTGSTTKNGKDIIDNQDQFYLGSTVPTSTGGLNNTIKWKNITFTLYLDWALGHSINQNSEMRYFMNTFANNYTLIDEVKKCWKQEGDATKYARFTANDPDDGNANFSRVSNIFNYKGDYLCVREIALSYSLPSTILKKIGIQDLTFTVAGNNLHYFTAVKGVSPEEGTSSTYSGNYYNYPPIKKISLGIKATF